MTVDESPYIKSTEVSMRVGHLTAVWRQISHEPCLHHNMLCKNITKKVCTKITKINPLIVQYIGMARHADRHGKCHKV